MDVPIVCVLDLDETLGFYDGKVFHVRPKFNTFLLFLKYIKAKIILWSLGSDDYVRRVIQGYLPELADNNKMVYKRFARSESYFSNYHYQKYKSSKHIRHLFKPYTIFLIAVDDKVGTNMDDEYDLRVHVKPYLKVNSCDKELSRAIETILNGMDKLSKDTNHV